MPHFQLILADPASQFRFQAEREWEETEVETTQVRASCYLVCVV